LALQTKYSVAAKLLSADSGKVRLFQRNTNFNQRAPDSAAGVFGSAGPCQKPLIRMDVLALLFGLGHGLGFAGWMLQAAAPDRRLT